MNFLIFFWDPLEPMPHDPDVKALLRMAAVWNIPIACNRASADFMISSPLMDGDYLRLVPDYEDHRGRSIAGMSLLSTDWVAPRAALRGPLARAHVLDLQRLHWLLTRHWPTG